MQVICEHPKVILHPKAAEYFSKFRRWFILGRKFEYTVHRHPDEVYLSRWLPHLWAVTKDNVDSCYFYNSNGETAPMYIVVPCGHCDVCSMRHINSDVDRLKMEAECYDCQPWFVTLTYNEEHVRKPKFQCIAHDYIRPPFYNRVPLYHNNKRVGFLGDSCAVHYEPVGGVNVRDCQLFLKRFRINLKRAGYDMPFRYYLVSEYSPDKKRPHYHAILYGLNTKTAADYFCVESILANSWDNGYIYARRIDMQTDKSFYYTTKYMRKSRQQEIPTGCRKNFVLASRGNGGIGSRFIDTRVVRDVRKNYDTSFKYTSKWSNKVVELKYSSYVLNRIFPSFSRLVSLNTRKALNNLSYYAIKIFKYSPNHEAVFKYQDLRSRFSKYLYMPVLSNSTCTSISRFSNLERNKTFIGTLVSKFSECYRIIHADVRFVGRYLSFAQKAQKARERFLEKLFEFVKPVDIFIKSYNAKKQLNYKPSMTNYVDLSPNVASV